MAMSVPETLAGLLGAWLEGVARLQVRRHHLDPGLADDVAQEVRLRVLQGRVQVVHDVPAEQLLGGVVRNVAREFLRARGAAPPRGWEGAPARLPADDRHGAAEVWASLRERICSCTSNLTPRQRQAVACRIEGLGTAAAARRLGVRPPTFLQLLARAVRRLRGEAEQPSPTAPCPITGLDEGTGRRKRAADALRMRAHGESYAGIGHRMHCSKQAARSLVRRARHWWPGNC